MPPHRRNLQQTRSALITFALLLAVTALLAVAFITPLARLLEVSFGSILNPTWQYYDQVLHDRYFIRTLVRTIRIAALATVGSLLAGYPVAYVLVRTKGRVRHLIYVALIAPLLISVVVRTFSWILLLGSNGIINRTLMALGIIHSPLPLLYNDYAVAASLVQVFIPFMVLALIGSLATVPRQTEESAAVLGARPMTVFTRVTLPLSIPGIAAGCALVFSLAVGAFVTPAIVGGGKVETIPTLVYNYMMVRLEWDTGSAMAWVLMFVVGVLLALYFLQVQRMSRWRRMEGRK